MKVNKIAISGLFAALAIILGYVEVLIPISPIPGIKLGISNLALLISLVVLGPLYSFTIMIVKVIISSILFSGFSAGIYSLVAGITSVSIMILLYKTKSFSIIAISTISGLVHNLSQFAVAVAFIGLNSILYYLPFLVISGSLFGLLIGIVANKSISILKKYNN